MTLHIQHFDAPDGTRMVILPAVEFERIATLADEAVDAVAAEAELARIDAGGGTMPSQVLDAILDEGITPVAAWRRFRGLSQASLAAKARLSQVFVSKIERGENHGTPKTRRAISAALGAPLWALETEPGRMERLPDGAAGTISERILALLAAHPDLTAKRIAESLFGPGANQQRVNADCNLLLQHGTVERVGRGGNGDPFRYRLPGRRLGRI